MRVPLHELHAGLGARFVEFAGFEMPVQYSSILEEHDAVRTRAGLFDVSHMSNLWIRGKDATKLLSQTVGTNPERLKVGRASYTTAMREDGTIIDDLIYYRFGDDEYHVVPNAGMNKILTSWFTAHQGRDVQVEDASREYCIFALQGPRTRDILRRVLPEAADVKKFAFAELRFGKRKGFVSGTGYTGEDGVEFVVPNAEGAELFPKILREGKADGLVPVGLGARDTLRLEKGYCLASHEFAGGRTPLEAGLEWTVHWDHEFVGKAALEEQKRADAYERLVGLTLEDAGIPRQGHAILDGGQPIGAVTSGTLSPSLHKGIALGYVTKPFAQPGAAVAVDIRGRRAAARVQRPPFL
jgi:glycine cleavage system T protein (aminomethyltransferase)